MSEKPLSGGRVTAGVVRVDGTVRRPRRPNFLLVRALLRHLEDSQVDLAPRYLGNDELGREVFSFIEGSVPSDLDPTLPDGTLEAAAALIRRYHDATAGTSLARSAEVVCHNDLSPCNFVFRDGRPVAIIDFDAAAPGDRLREVGYALFLWLNLSADGPPAGHQAHRIQVFARAYGTEPGPHLVEAIISAVEANIGRMPSTRWDAPRAWWNAQLDWLKRHRFELSPTRDR